MRRFLYGWAALVALPSSLLFAADCSGLKNLNLPQTSIRLAEAVRSGALETEDSGPLRDLPPFCRVSGVLQPTADSAIRFEIWLPEQAWNGRLLGVGNGGFAGAIGYRQLAAYLERGFAVAGTDAGHQAEGTDASWAFGHPEKVRDFGWRAIHLTAERAKQILLAYYGKPQNKAYFDACSDGGREALMEAQRFPGDYDGILAGAPANAWTSLLGAGVGVLQHMVGDPAHYLPDRKLPAIERAALAACDASDGVKDGVITDPTKCRFDPQKLLCRGSDQADCLTKPQIDSLETLYAGVKDRSGALLFPGYAMGDETGWKEWVVGEDPESSLGARFVRNYFRYMVTGDPKWNVLSANAEESFRLAKEKSAADLDATNPNLGPFAARGGKLILYHGWDDAAISPFNTIAYFSSVQKTMGPEKAQAFVRLYMVPGMEHCFGGPGASAFGQLGMASAEGPKYGLFDSLENWVEKGSPLENLEATKYTAAPGGQPKPAFTRPLCAYPSVARYKGSGATTDAANFSCTSE